MRSRFHAWGDLRKNEPGPGACGFRFIRDVELHISQQYVVSAERRGTHRTCSLLEDWTDRKRKRRLHATPQDEAVEGCPTSEYVHPALS